MSHVSDATHCQDCGVALEPRARQSGRPRKWCKDCASLHYGKRSWSMPAPTHCVSCGLELRKRTRGGRPRKWCSRRCEYLKTYRLKIVHVKPKKRKPPPRLCTADGCDLKHYGLGFCRMHYGRFARYGSTDLPGRPTPSPKPKPLKMRTWTAGYCGECDGAFVTNQPQTRFCSTSCKRRNKDRVHEQRRSERIKAAGPRDRIDLPVLAKRDGWRCHLCGKRVTRKTWSVDHLIPLSHGGSHTYVNVALAHQRCNSLRRDTGMAQLRLAA